MLDRFLEFTESRNTPGYSLLLEEMQIEITKGRHIGKDWKDFKCKNSVVLSPHGVKTCYPAAVDV